jgi:hypothetical protein
MSWSLGEAKALAIKAARGGGMPWGMAEEAGFAVRWLQSHGAPGVAALAAYLDWRDGLAKVDHDLCPISLGTAFMDAGRGVPAHLGRVRQPLLLAPFIAACRPSGIRMQWQGVSLTLSEAGLVTDASRAQALTSEADCTTERTVAQVAHTATRVPEKEATAMAELNHFAARTYAPATEASRLSGAGAGTSDND